MGYAPTTWAMAANRNVRSAMRKPRRSTAAPVKCSARSSPSVAWDFPAADASLRVPALEDRRLFSGDVLPFREGAQQGLLGKGGDQLPVTGEHMAAARRAATSGEQHLVIDQQPLARIRLAMKRHRLRQYA